MLKLSQHSEDANCPVCSTPVGDEARECGLCFTPHHKDCWEYLGGCAVFACRKSFDHKELLNEEEMQKFKADTERWIKWHICYVLIGGTSRTPKSLLTKVNLLEKSSLTYQQLEQSRKYAYAAYWAFFFIFYLLVKDAVAISEQFRHLFFYRLLGTYRYIQLC